MAAFNWLDLFLGLILLFSFVGGLIRGFSKVAILFAGTVAGLGLAIWFYPAVAALLLPLMSGPVLANFVAFLLIFLGVQLTANLMSWVIGKFVKVSGLTWLDRILGGAFGLLRAMLICTVLVLGLMAFPFRPIAGAVATSEIAPYCLGMAQVITTIAPEELKHGFAETYARVKQLWDSASSEKKAAI